MTDRPLLYGPDNRIIDYSAPPVESIATIGQVWDPFASRQIHEEVTPKFVARALGGTYPLEERQLLCKRVLKNDGHFAGSYRAMTTAVSGLDWESLPVDKKLRKEQRIAEKVRDYVQQQLANMPIEELVNWLCDGEYSPFAWAENQFDLRTKELRGWNLVDGARQHWDFATSSLHILTKKEMSRGEALAPNMWAVHSSHLYPGDELEGGSWTAVLWRYCFKHWATGDWLEFMATYGKPWRLAFIRDPKDRDSVIKALRMLGVNASGAFPEGTEVKLERGNSAGAIEVFQKMGEESNDEVSILFTGHPLISASKPGAGTLAGNGAQRVHERILKKIARGIMRTFWRDVVMPMVSFKFGYETAALYTSPDATFKLKYEPPRDQKERAVTLSIVNKSLLAPLGKAIEQQQVQEEFGIATLVDIKTADPNAAPDAPGANQEEAGADESTAAANRHRSGRELAAAAKGTTPLETHEDVEQLAGAIAQRGFAAIGESIQKQVDAIDLNELAASMWESYGEKPTKRLASLTRDALVTAHVIGRGDANADS